MKPLEIFRAGTHRSYGGHDVTVTEVQLAECARAYDPKLLEAPFVIGHPKIDDPAYGAVKALVARGPLLDAIPDRVDEQFAELVNAGRYDKISVSLYLPDSPGNPVPGVHYLRHVGFLGAAAPAVKGLRRAQFAADEDGVVTLEFSEYSGNVVARLFRGFREWLLTAHGRETADQVVPSYDVEALEREATQEQEEIAPTAVGFTDPIGDDPMSEQDKQRIAQLEADNARLKQDAIERDKRDKAERRAQRHGNHVAFCESLAKAGKPLGEHVDGMVAVLDFMADAEGTVEFGEGDDHVSTSPDKALRSLFEALPKWVEFGEIAKPEHQAADLSDQDVAARARDYHARRAAEGRMISFAEAVDAVRSGKDKEVRQHA